MAIPWESFFCANKKLGVIIINYIYGFQNKINGKWYIGQTTQNPEYRRRQHFYSALHYKKKDDSLFHKKIREYGKEAFDFFVLEEVEHKDMLDDREKYWISYYKSYIKDGNGYNLSRGGQQKRKTEGDFSPNCSFQTKEEIDCVIYDIKYTKDSFQKLGEKYNVSATLICNINRGKRYKRDNETYPLRPYKRTKIDDTQVEEIILLLEKGLSNDEIAKQLHIDGDVVWRINNGRSHVQLDRIYPIRKEDSKEQKRANKIKELLAENKLNNKEIADIVKCDPSVVSNINYGKRYFDANIDYPIRKN